MFGSSSHSNSSDSVPPFDSSPLVESDSAKPEEEAFEAISFKLLAPTSLEVEGCETRETPETSLEGWSNQEPLSLAASSFFLLSSKCSLSPFSSPRVSYEKRDFVQGCVCLFDEFIM